MVGQPTNQLAKSRRASAILGALPAEHTRAQAARVQKRSSLDLQVVAVPGSRRTHMVQPPGAVHPPDKQGRALPYRVHPPDLTTGAHKSFTRLSPPRAFTRSTHWACGKHGPGGSITRAHVTPRASAWAYMVGCLVCARVVSSSSASLDGVQQYGPVVSCLDRARTAQKRSVRLD